MPRKRKYFLLFIILFGTIMISGCSNILFGPSGSIEITSTPSGANISLDGEDIRKETPYTLKNVSAGNHVIELTLPDMKYTKIVDVKVYQTTNINIEFYSQITLDKINVLPSTTNITLSLGNSITISSVTAYYSDYSSANIPLTNCTYSSNDSCATVNSSGTITGISAGAAIITVSYSEGGVTKTDIVLVYIRNIPEDTPIEPILIEPEPDEPEPEPSGKVVVTLDNVGQEYYESLGYWSMVRAYYTVNNNSDTMINNYMIFFSVECTDGSIYYDSGYGGYTLSPGKSHSDYTLLYTFDKEAKKDTVRIIEIQVNPFD